MGERDGPEPDGATPEARQWVARRDAVRRAAEADRAAAAETDEDRAREADRDGPNPVALLGGVGVLVLILLACWFLFDRMRCDPFYSDRGLVHRQACR